MGEHRRGREKRNRSKTYQKERSHRGTKQRQRPEEDQLKQKERRITEA